MIAAVGRVVIQGDGTCVQGHVRLRGLLARPCIMVVNVLPAGARLNLLPPPRLNRLQVKDGATALVITPSAVLVVRRRRVAREPQSHRRQRLGPYESGTCGHTEARTQMRGVRLFRPRLRVMRTGVQPHFARAVATGGCGIVLDLPSDLCMAECAYALIVAIETVMANEAMKHHGIPRRSALHCEVAMTGKESGDERSAALICLDGPVG